MANNLSKQIVEEGYRNAVVKLSATLDTSNISWVPAIALSDFISNDKAMGRLVGLRIDELQYSSGPTLVTSVEWQSSTPQLIAAFAQSDELEFAEYGGLQPDRTISGYTGGINVKTLGFPAGGYESFTIVLTMDKIYSQSGL